MEHKTYSNNFRSMLVVATVLLASAFLIPMAEVKAQAVGGSYNLNDAGTPVLRAGISNTEANDLLNAIRTRISEQFQILPVATPVVSGATSPFSGNACQVGLARNMSIGAQGADVKRLQQFLNTNSATQLTTAIGGPGNETEYFGPATANAVARFQEMHRAAILAPVGLSSGSGFVGESTRRQIGNLCAGTSGSVTPQPIISSGSVDFSATPRSGDAPLRVTFSVRTTGDASNRYSIEFGDGNGDSLTPSRSVSHTYTTPGTYTVKLMQNYPCPSISGVGDFACPAVMVDVSSLTITVRGTTQKPEDDISNPPEVPTEQVVLFNENNIYSPTPIMVGSATHLYFGGWLKDGQVNDNIYRAVCNSSGKSCGSIQTVIDAASHGFEHLNDPSVVRIAGNNTNGGRDYFIMYMTGVLKGEDGFVPTNNDIYYSTSWADDGVNWSKPTKVVEDHWLPSATLNSAGEVELFANDNGIHGNVTRLNMGKSGVERRTTARVDYGKISGTDTLYSNAYVQYMPSQRQYYILAERMNAPSAIDAFVSSNGVTWELSMGQIITLESGQERVGTPAFHPNNTNLIYFASTGRNDSMGYKIRYAEPMDRPFSN